MKTKIVYILVSSENDIYAEQAFVSMFSLRHFNKDAYIVLLTDSLTAATFTGLRKNMISYANEIVTVELNSNLTGQQRSRQLKTSVRNLIDGDFLFIDCDTIITRDISCIDNITADIAACRDTHSAFIDNPYRERCLKYGHLLKWPIDEEKDYFNSGVIFVKDVPATRLFYQKWNYNLNAGYKRKVFMDQPSFAKTNHEMGHVIQHLPDEWNCELKHGIRYLKDAYIVHYLCTNPSSFQDRQLFLLNEKDILLEVKRTGVINDVIKAVIDDPFKGLAEITHCFAGEDVLFFRQDCYSFVRNFYSRDRHGSILIWFLNFLFLINKVYKRCLKIIVSSFAKD